MRSSLSAGCIALLLAASSSAAHDTQSTPARAEAAVAAAPAAEPVAAASHGVEDLELRELYGPVGRRGLVYSEKARRLAGRRVRVRGYMVAQDRPVPGRYLLAPLPLRLHETEYGHADDLPAATLFVWTPDDAERVAPYTPGLLERTGILELTPRAEPDGRVSAARLVVRPDPIPDTPTAEPRRNSP